MLRPSPAANYLVIGGGPAGSMLAMRLAAAGRRVVLIEKQREAHHKVCGEFLSREAIHYLEQQGIAPRALGAVEIGRVRISSGKRVAEAHLPFPALSLSRKILDEALLMRATERCEMRRGCAVESLETDPDGWTAKLGQGRTLRASAAFLATGKHDLRGWPRAPGKQDGLIGFKMHWRLATAQTRALRGRMDLFVFSGGYGGLSLIENDAANLCLVVRRSTLRIHGEWTGLLSAILAGNRTLHALLDGAEPQWPRPLAISPIPLRTSRSRRPANLARRRSGSGDSLVHR
jgi:flavin-dependent dehydrogenase